MTLNERQKAIIKFAQGNGGKISKKQANELIAHTYYHNGAKYVGEILTRLVKRQVLRRESIGNYVFTGVLSGIKVEPVPENQINLF